MELKQHMLSFGNENNTSQTNIEENVDVFNRTSIHLEELKDIFNEESMNNVVKKTFHIEMQYKDVLFRFFKLKIKTPELVGYTHVYPEAGECSSNYRYRFIIINLISDFVLCYFKMADDRRGHRYIQFYEPISLNGIKNNEYIVIKELTLLNTDLRLFTLKQTNDKYIFNNYYNTEQSSEFIFSNKWKSKNQINKFEKLNGLKVEFKKICEPETIDKIINISCIWEKVKKQHSDKRYDKKLLQMMSKYDSITLMLISINNHIIAFSIGFEFVNNFQIIHTEKHISVCDIDFIKEYAETDDETAKIIKNRLSAYIQFKSHEYYIKTLKKEALFYEGDVHLKNLSEYKKMFYKNCSYYYDTPLKSLDTCL